MTGYTVQVMKYLDSLLSKPNRVFIISGEGELGTVELFNGKRTRRAIVRRLNKERCGGDRWSFAIIEDKDGANGAAVKWDGKADLDLTTSPAFPN